MNGLFDHLAVSLDPALLAEAVGLHPLDHWQAAALSSTSKRQLWNIHRQGGKSAIAGLRSIHQAAFSPRSLVLIVSPSLRQSGEMLRKVQEYAAALRLETIGDSATRLELANGSRVVSLPGSEQTIRGFSAVDLLVIDEASRCDDSLVSACKPFLAVSDGSLIALSTPAGRRGFFFRWWHEGEGWERVSVRADQCARISPAFLAEELKELGPLLFSQEYGSPPDPGPAFVDDGTAAFSSVLIEAAVSSAVRPLWEIAA